MTDLHLCSKAKYHGPIAHAEILIQLVLDVILNKKYTLVYRSNHKRITPAVQYKEKGRFHLNLRF